MWESEAKEPVCPHFMGLWLLEQVPLCPSPASPGSVVSWHHLLFLGPGWHYRGGGDRPCGSWFCRFHLTVLSFNHLWAKPWGCCPVEGMLPFPPHLVASGDLLSQPRVIASVRWWGFPVRLAPGTRNICWLGPGHPISSQGGEAAEGVGIGGGMP